MTSDEDYLIGRAVSCLKTDPASAKSWMLFAKSVFPQSFPVQFQAYKMECDQNNFHECASYLTELIKKFPNESALIKEQKNIASALACDEDSFLKQLFSHLSDDMKYDLMIAVTRNVKSVKEHCELMLLFLKRMPNSRLLQHGGSIVDTLLAAEESLSVNTPVNLFRKMLVCDALPLILKIGQFEYKSKIVFQLLQKAIEFYASSILVPAEISESSKKEAAISSDQSFDEMWKPLLKLIETVAVRYRWSYPELFVSNFNELSLHQLLLLSKRRNKLINSLVNENRRHEDSSGYEEAYIYLIVIYFYYLHQFGKIVRPKIFAKEVTGPYNFVLVEGIRFPLEECSQSISSDYRRTERGFITMQKNSSSDSANILILSFLTAVECWEILHRHQGLTKEFKNLCKNTQLESWPIFKEFYVNLLIYQGSHHEAIEHLSRVQENSSDISLKNKASLQMASCLNFTGSFQNSLEVLFSVVARLSPLATYVYKPLLPKCSSRYIYFMGCNNNEILQYCITMLLQLYKCKKGIDDTFKDMAFGFMLILMQYDVEREVDSFNMCIDEIKKNKNFCFQKFFNYIIHVDILEEFSYLTTVHGGNIDMDLLHTSTFQVGKQRAVTRGVNKGAKDDLKQAFINQMARCYDNLDNLYIDFIKEEQHFLLLILTNG